MLNVCATPIGNLGDVTLRVLDALRDADLVAAEDTRRTRKLLSRHDVHTPLMSLHEHNEAARAGQLLERLRAGETIALVSDAGTPLISDPGARLVAAAIEEGLEVRVLPGPSAVIASVVASGLAADGAFRFVGYLPRRRGDLERAWRSWRRDDALVVAFESPRRLAGSLAALAELAPGVPAAVCRELTKLHEDVWRGTLAALAGRYTRDDAPPRGEITLVIDAGAGEAEGTPDEEAAADAAGALLARGLSKRDTAAALSVCLGLRRRDAERLTRSVAAGPPGSERPRPAAGRSPSRTVDAALGVDDPRLVD